METPKSASRRRRRHPLQHACQHRRGSLRPSRSTGSARGVLVAPSIRRRCASATSSVVMESVCCGMHFVACLARGSLVVERPNNTDSLVDVGAVKSSVRSIATMVLTRTHRAFHDGTWCSQHSTSSKTTQCLLNPFPLRFSHFTPQSSPFSGPSCCSFQNASLILMVMFLRLTANRLCLDSIIGFSMRQ